MSNPSSSAACTFTIVFLDQVAQQVEEAARKEGLGVSELFQRIFRAYQFEKFERNLDRIRSTLPPTDCTPDEVEALVKEVRREMYEERKSKAAPSK